MPRLCFGARRIVTSFLYASNQRPEEVTVMTLAEENRVARSMGLSYGKYKALMYVNKRQAPPTARKPVRKSRRKYTDEEAFALWQEGKNDCEIGAILGVSRQMIQKWRDVMELPSTNKTEIDTGSYHLVRTHAGVFVICGEEE